MTSSMSSERILLLLIRWAILGLAVWVASEIVTGIRTDGWQSAMLVAAILGLLNLYLRPILTLLTLPLTVVSLGLFLVVINAALLGLTSWIAGWSNLAEFEVDSAGSALLGALIISLVSLIIGMFVRPQRLARGMSGRFE